MGHQFQLVELAAPEVLEMTPNGAWCRVDDGIVSGRLLRVAHACDVCGVTVACIEVDGYELGGVPWHRTIIRLPRPNATVSERMHNPPEVAVFLGIGCGCYTKFHRQVAHIRDSIEEGRDFPQS